MAPARTLDCLVIISPEAALSKIAQIDAGICSSGKFNRLQNGDRAGAAQT